MTRASSTDLSVVFGVRRQLWAYTHFRGTITFKTPFASSHGKKVYARRYIVTWQTPSCESHRQSLHHPCPCQRLHSRRGPARRRYPDVRRSWAENSSTRSFEPWDKASSPLESILSARACATSFRNASASLRAAVFPATSCPASALDASNAKLFRSFGQSFRNSGVDSNMSIDSTSPFTATITPTMFSVSSIGFRSCCRYGDRRSTDSASE